MAVTRKGLKEASGAITGAVAVGTFAACLWWGVPFFGALIVASVAAVPFQFVEILFDFPDMVRHWRAHWRFHAAVMALMVGLIAAWRLYASAAEFTKEQRIQSALSLGWVLPILAVVAYGVAFKKGWTRRIG